ncbi:hypothetical protein Tco_0823966 [Tanacetum coccineum]|uniref:Zinc finger, CCHC-type n=1 Tax=Tanacetum coccineum TaxID=301880 RepID=A0ABQ5AMG9_9ASTR
MTTFYEKQILMRTNVAMETIVVRSEIAPVAIINHQLPFEYTIASRSTDVMVELKSMFEKQAGVERFNLIQTFHACKQEEGKPVGPYVIKMKGFLRNYNIHNIGNMIGELHTLLVEYEKGLPKKAATPQVIAIQEHPAKDDACHHCKVVGHYKRNYLAYLVELIKKKKKVGTASSSDYGISVSKNDVLYFNAILRDGIYEIDMLNFVPNVNYFYNVSIKRAKHNLDSTYLWHCCFALLISVYLSKKRIKKLQHDGLLKSTDDESFDQCVSCLSGNTTRKPFPYHTERATDLLGLIHNDDYALESTTRILSMVPTKKVDKTPYELCGRAVELKEIQDEDTSPSENTSEIPAEVEGFEPPEEEEAHVRRSERTHQAPEHLCLNWLDAMNAKMKSMKDNQVWCLVDLPPNDSGTDTEPLEQVQYDTDDNVFANDIQHYEQSESITNTCAVETCDSNVNPDSPDMCDNDIQDD